MLENFDWQSAFAGAAAGGSMGAAVAIIFTILAFAFSIYWVYTSFAWMNIAKKLKYKNSWIAWLPFARTAMIFQLGNFHWALAFLWIIPLVLGVIPILGWIVSLIVLMAIFAISLIAIWRIFEKRKYPGWLALIPLSVLIPLLSFVGGVIFLVVLGFVAWREASSFKKKKPKKKK